MLHILLRHRQRFTHQSHRYRYTDGAVIVYPVLAHIFKNFIPSPAAYQINAVDQQIDAVSGCGFLHFGKTGAELQVYRIVFV